MGWAPPFPPHPLPSPPPSPLLLGRQMSAQLLVLVFLVQQFVDCDKKNGTTQASRWTLAMVRRAPFTAGCSGTREGHRGESMVTAAHPLSWNDTEEMCILLREDARKIRECSQVSFFFH